MDSPQLPNFTLRKPAGTVESGFISALEKEKRRVDKGKFLIEAKMGLWNVNEDSSYWKKKHDRRYWHFRDSVLPRKEEEKNEVKPRVTE